MLFQTAEKFLSPTRLAPYKHAAKGNEQLSLTLYLDNLRVAQSFYPALSLLEVALRNAVHDALSVKFKTDNWLFTEQQGFMIDPSLTYYDAEREEKIINHKVLKMVLAAIKDYKEQRKQNPPNGPAIIADLNFGFWTSLFNKKYFLLLNRDPLRAFSKERPAGITWNIINDKLIKVRTFRNRVYHYEPLCFQKNTNNILCFDHLQEIHTDITELLTWLSPELKNWLVEVDLVPEKLKKLRKKYSDAQ